MIFTLYSAATTNCFRYEYEINNLVGAFDNKSLPKLLTSIKRYDYLLHYDLCSLKDYLDATTKAVATQLFSRTYTDVNDFKANMPSDLQTALPEHFI